MTRAFLTAAIAMLSLGAAHAETAKPRPGNVPGIDPSKKVCYYEASGFTYHYVIELGLVPQSCAMSIETPFAPLPQGWAVLLKEEVEPHGGPFRLCYYGLAHGRVEVERVSSSKGCNWTAGREFSPPVPSEGRAQFDHEEDATSVTTHGTARTNSKICFYHLPAVRHPARFTHYMTISKYSQCPEFFEAK